MELDQRIQRAEAAAATLREATREAHEAMQGLRALKREVIRDFDVRVAALSGATERTIHDTVEAGLDRYKATLDKAIVSATQAVYDRFDLLATIMLGEERTERPVSELLRRHLQRLCNCDGPPHRLECPVKEITG